MRHLLPTVGFAALCSSLAAGVAESETSKREYYLDDVQVRLINNPAPLP